VKAVNVDFGQKLLKVIERGDFLRRSLSLLRFLAIEK